MHRSIRIFVLHRFKLLIDALAGALARVDGVRVTGSARDVESAVGLLAELETDVVLVDAALGMSRAELESLRAAVPRARILPLGVDDEEVRPWLEAGASGYLPPGTSLQDLVELVRVVHSGETEGSTPLANAVLARVAEIGPEDRAEPAPPPVTKREREILELLAEGLTNQEIAERLGIALATVKIHVHRIFRKLDVHTRKEAVRRFGLGR